MNTLIKNGDGVILWNGEKGIALSKPFQPKSMAVTGLVVVVSFDGGDFTFQMPVEMRSIVEVWRGGNRIDTAPDAVQLELL